MTQILKAREGIISQEMERVAVDEKLKPEVIRERVASGRIVIPSNINHKGLKPRGVGEGLRVKINANIGTSQQICNLDHELNKLKAAVKYGTDSIMDLSTGGNLDIIRKKIIEHCELPVGTVPMYQVISDLSRESRDFGSMQIGQLFEAIEKHAEDGVDFITVHVGITREVLGTLAKKTRVTEVVSRGGSLMVAWMEKNNAENPLYERFDELLAICRKHDVTLSLGDGLRPGSIADATDNLQLMELMKLGELVQIARMKGVQVMVEGPGHVPINQIEMNVKLMKRLCDNAPFYVLGPLVTDVAPGYDHITAAIGGAWAGYFGADFLCYVTPAEHLGLPTIKDVEEGVVALRIAAHSADLARGNADAYDWDLRMSKARKELDWEEQFQLSINPEKARKIHQERGGTEGSPCSMCGELCAVKTMNERCGQNG